MPRIRVSETLPFSPKQIYDLVVDVGQYPQFLPWCVKSRTWDHQPNQFMAELTVSFKGIRESFQTLDIVVPEQKVEINLKSGPFQYLVSTWIFSGDQGATKVDFFIDFKFDSKMKEMIMGPVFSQVSKQMIGAFRKRAAALYGRGVQ
ncbi:MAG: cyclase/dehydrase [Magnetococcales bacterium]|nr:cyclase/dehydrase [Magnetococcales bacterium]HIJ85520.1 type II toxin-antitoxin system RatA family toxin [Magnetococcales bacterium]